MRALLHYEVAARGDALTAHMALGYRYLKGRGVVKDVSDSMMQSSFESLFLFFFATFLCLLQRGLDRNVSDCYVLNGKFVEN